MRYETAYFQDIKPLAQWALSDSIDNPMGSAMAKVRQLESYYFYMNSLGQEFGWDRAEDHGGIVPRRIGLISQELQAVEPSLVRVMDWLDTDEDYYWVDYEALNALLLDALNELNVRADAIKQQLGMSVTEQYANPQGIPAQPTNLPALVSLSATPVNGTEGSQVTWTVTAQNAYEGMRVFFKLGGNCNIDDITPGEGLSLWNVNAHITAGNDIEGYDPDVNGWARGHFVFGADTQTATFVMNYVNDNTIEGTETITMTLVEDARFPNYDGSISATATVSDN